MTDNVEVSRRTVLAAGAGMFCLAACGAGSSGGSPKLPKTGQQVMPLSDLPVGTAKVTKVGDAAVVVGRTAENTVVGFSAYCTHQGTVVNVDGAQLVCPLHGSEFAAFTGAVERGPAARRLPKVPVHIDNGEIVTG
jgi:nitrite reductase/ring-hydroxylating ferredoxin subunit